MINSHKKNRFKQQRQSRSFTSIEGKGGAGMIPHEGHHPDMVEQWNWGQR